MAGFGPHGGGGDYGDGEGDDAPQWEQQGRKMREKAEQQLQILKSRLVSFGDRAKAVLTGKPAGGYTDLNQSLLSQGEGEEDPTVDAHPSAGAAGRQHHQQQVARVVQHIPSQTELLLELTHLSKEAAELLWETIAMQSESEMAASTLDLVENASMLQKQLRGLVSDVSASDGTTHEHLVAEALEAHDVLTHCLGEYQQQKQDPPPQSASPQDVPPQGAIPQGATQSHANPQERPPLIQLDDPVPVSGGGATGGDLSPGVDPFLASPDALPAKRSQ